MSDNDWLKYNASEYTVNGVTYRNLEAQVLKNKEDIEAIDVSQLQSDVEQLQLDVAGKQDTLTAGSNITISGDTISATDTTYSAGSGISISAENEISTTVVGIPEGGTTGQVLKKVNGDDFNVEWANGGGGGTPEVLWCTTSTTYAEITAALAAHQLPVLYVSMRIYTYYEDPTASTYRFVAVDPLYMAVRYYDVTTSDVWTASSKDISELEKNTATVSIASTDWQSAGGGTFYDVTVTVTGMTASATTWVSPDPSSAYDYADAGIICSAQASNSLTFRTKGTDAPSGSISVNVVWLT